MRRLSRYWRKPSRVMSHVILGAVTAVVLLAATIPAGGAVFEPTNQDLLNASQAAANVAVLESDTSSTTLDISIPALEEQEITANDETFQLLTIPGYDYTTEVGKPQLPAIRETVGIPDGASVTVTILETSVSTDTGYKVYPVQQPEFDSDNDSEFVIDEEFYVQDTFYPEEIVQVGDPAIWRDVSVISLQVNPVQFNPATGELKVYDRIQIKLEYSGGVDVRKTIEPKFDQMYREAILNYDFLDTATRFFSIEDIPAATDALPIPDGAELDGTPVISSIKMLSIRANPTIPFSSIKPLLDWHKKRGLPYISYGLTEPVSASSVKSLINSVYTSHPELEYVLLVGDIDLINWQANWNGMPGDYWYACLTGGATPDLYPEVAVGRLTVNNTTELTTQINKIINYSDSPPGGSWVDRVVLVAHKELAPGKYQGCKEDIRTTAYTDGFTFNTRYGAAPAQGGSDATNAQVTADINAGRGIVNYRGHGGTGSPYARPWGTYWGTNWNTSNEEWTTTNAHALANGNYTPVVFSISCLNNALDNTSPDECLGEAFIKDSNSAVAFLGATRPSYTTPNHEFDKDLFDAIGNEHIYHIGWVLNDANTELVNRYGAGSYYTDNCRMYLWLGDPALELWSAAPRTLTVTHAATVQTSISVTVKDAGTAVPNALVCLTKGDPVAPDIYTYALTNASGVASFTFNASSDGPMNISVTKHNYLPYTGTTTIDRAAPVVTVLTPNGGEVWGVGETHNITWTATDTITTIDLYYSLNGGSTYSTIATGRSNTGTYAWTIPNTPSPACRVKVAAHDDAGFLGEDISNANFTIGAADIRVKPPAFDVTLPPNTTWSGKLTINNAGAQTLVYNIRDTETTGGPYFKWAKPTPTPLPAGESGKIEAMVNNPDGLGDIDFVRIWVTQRTVDSAYMRDDGVAPDAVADDGIYTCNFYGTSIYGEEWGATIEAKDMAGNVGHVTCMVFIDFGDAAPTDTDLFAFAEGNAAVNLTPMTPPAGGQGSSSDEVVESEAVSPTLDLEGLTSVAVFLDTNPWSYTAIQDILAANGISYTIFNSSQMGVVDISGYDKVITASVQGDAFWNALAANKAWFESYVSAGGTLEMHLCAQSGDTAWSKVFPGGFDTTYGLSQTISISVPTHPVVNIPNVVTDAELDNWNSSTHGYFSAVPGGASVILRETGGNNPVWAEAKFGQGYIMATVQTVEWRAGHGYPQFLENMILYMPMTDCPWLNENPKTGSLAAYSGSNIDITINTAGLAAGEYTAEMWIGNNDPGDNPTIVPVKLTVKPAIQVGKVLFDETHNPYYTLSGYYADLASLLTSWGFTVEKLTTGPVTLAKLSGYCAVVISNPRIDYTDAEIVDIAEYVNLGGGLLILGEWGSWAESNGVLPIVNELAAPFNMTFNNDIVRDSIHNDGGYASWPLIPDFDASVVGADVDTIVEYAGCSVGTTNLAFPIAWAYSSAHMDMTDMMEFLMDGTPDGAGEPSGTPVQPQVDQTQVQVPEGIDATTGEEISPQTATKLLTPLRDTDGGGKVLWDLTHGVYLGYQPADYFSTLVTVLTEKGYTVETTSGGILNVNLDEYAVLVVCVGSAWSSTYTPQEVTAIVNFVEAGGGLLVMGDNAGVPNGNINPVSQEFGTTCGISTPPSGMINNLAVHPIFDGVTQFEVGAPGEISCISPSEVVAWHYNADEPIVSVASGSGRLVVVGDINLWDNDLLSSADNQLFAENVFDWLSTPPEPVPVMAASLFGDGRAVIIGDGGVFQNSDPDGDGIMCLYEYDNEKLAVNVIDWLCQPVAPRKPDLVVIRKYEEPATPKMYLHPAKAPMDPRQPITAPVDTVWHELYPVYCPTYDLLDWKDNGDRVLSPSDWIILRDTNTGESGEYHVDEMTITILFNDKSVALEFYGGYKQVPAAIADPVNTYWHEVYPTFCRDFQIVAWRDAGDKGLSAGDTIVLEFMEPGYKPVEVVIDEVTWDIIVSPPLQGGEKTYKVTYTIRNQGTATADAGHSTTLYIDKNPVEHKVVPVNLAPGATYTDTFLTIVECTEGEDLVTVYADNYRQVDELNENNNALHNVYSCCEPGIEVIKKVWDRRTQEWVEEICAQVKETVVFQCVILNTSECCDLTRILINDVLSDSMKYVEGSATVNGKPWEPREVGPNIYEWDMTGWILPPGGRIVIEFAAVVVKWSEKPDINLQSAKAWCEKLEISVYDEDTAAVQPFIPGDANMDGAVNVFDLPVEKRIILGQLPPTCGADANQDGAINVFDLVKIKRIILGLP